MEKKLLHSGFLKSVTTFPDRPALVVEGKSITYLNLFRKAASLAATILSGKITDGSPLTAVFAYRSETAFSGVLGSLMLGNGYVPLNRTFPVERTKTMLQLSGCRSMIVDKKSELQLEQVLSDIDYEMVIVLPDCENVQELSKKWPLHKFYGASHLLPPEKCNLNIGNPYSPAYVLFTSGTTGMPKGVVVTHMNTRNYIDFVTKRYSITEQDRFSQMFDMTFDLSVADMFVAWDKGACVCCPTEKSLLNPGRFINDCKISVWFSVPSTAIFMKKFGSLKPGSYPGLRLSMFCGEALPIEVVRTWAEAAPNSIIENLYGPTELTIACMYYRWDTNSSINESEMGIVPVGEPFPGMVPLVLDDFLNEVPPGETGELVMSGPQVSAGYFNDDEMTAKAFVKPSGRKEMFYRTGDRVRKPVGNKPMIYLGRIDNQVKILGHRVELAEIEAIVREETGIDGVVAVGWPISSIGANGVELFIQSTKNDANLKEKIAARLPRYMVPKRFHYFKQLPLNLNGKFDRKELLKYLEEINDCVE